jgi:hypothetical protein
MYTKPSDFSDLNERVEEYYQVHVKELQEVIIFHTYINKLHLTIQDMILCILYCTYIGSFELFCLLLRQGKYWRKR